MYLAVAHRDLMADNTPPDHLSTLLTVAGSVVTTVVGLKAWGPLGRWLGKRIETAQQIRAAERGDVIARLTVDLHGAREENVQLRQELGEERELRMSFVADYAALKAEVEMLRIAFAEEKKECQSAIRELKREIRELKRQRSADHP